MCDLLNESGLWMREMGCKTIRTTIHEAQMCDLLNESGLWMREMNG
jgi:hypothetical protein